MTRDELVNLFNIPLNIYGDTALKGKDEDVEAVLKHDASQRATIEDLLSQLQLAAALYHPTIDRQEKQIEQQAKEIERLRKALNPAIEAIKLIDLNPNDMRLRRKAEISCFYGVQQAQAALKEGA